MKKIYLFLVVFLLLPVCTKADNAGQINLNALTPEIKKIISDVKLLSDEINKINHKTTMILKENDPKYTSINVNHSKANSLGPNLITIHKNSRNNIDLTLYLSSKNVSWSDGDYFIANKAVSINKDKKFNLCVKQNIDGAFIDLFYEKGLCQVDFVNEEWKRIALNYAGYLKLILKASKEINSIVDNHKNNSSGDLFETIYPDVNYILNKMHIKWMKI